MATAGATRIPILELSAVTEIPTATKMAVFGDPDSNGVRLLGYIDMGAGFVPLSGTKVDKPAYGKIYMSEDFGGDVFGDIRILYDQISLVFDSSYYNPLGSPQAWVNPFGFYSNTDLGVYSCVVFDVKGFLGNAFFNKQNDPNAYAQLGDIASINNTATALSLASLNADYAVQGVGFKVICPTINLIYIKSSLTTWEQFSTTTVV